MWQRMSESEGGGKGINVDFMSTHPANAKRIQVSQVHPLSGQIGKDLDLTLLATKQMVTRGKLSLDQGRWFDVKGRSVLIFLF